MARLQTGIVTNIYRDGHASVHTGDADTPIVHVTLMEAAADHLTAEERIRLTNLPATFDGGPPPPLSVVNLDTKNHELHVLGTSRGHTQEVLREHWLAWANNAGDAGPYDVTITGGGTGAAIGSGEHPDAIGTLVHKTNSGSGSLTTSGKKVQSYRAKQSNAVWYQGRVMLNPPVSYIAACFGLTNNIASTSSGVDISVVNNSASTTPSWEARAYTTNTFSNLTLPHIAVPSGAEGTAPTSWYDLDILLDPGLSFAAYWINGDGPYVITTNIPTTGLIPYFSVRTYTGSSRAVFEDLQFVDILEGVDIRHPLEDASFKGT